MLPKAQPGFCFLSPLKNSISHLIPWEKHLPAKQAGVKLAPHNCPPEGYNLNKYKTDLTPNLSLFPCSKFQGLPEALVTLLSYLLSNQHLPHLSSSLVPATIISSALVSSAPNSHLHLLSLLLTNYITIQNNTFHCSWN